MNQDKIKEEVAQQVATDWRAEQYDRHREDVEEIIQYAVKHGMIGDEAEGWNEKQREDYYNDCMAFEPEQDFTGASDDQEYPDR